uniref:Uncharacterized protein n=1 Tax=Arion vulgaris TaxID=1028688 RepID=A0A0B6Z9M7_9EUPU
MAEVSKPELIKTVLSLQVVIIATVCIIAVWLSEQNSKGRQNPVQQMMCRKQMCWTERLRNHCKPHNITNSILNVKKNICF